VKSEKLRAKVCLRVDFAEIAGFAVVVDTFFSANKVNAVVVLTARSDSTPLYRRREMTARLAAEEDEKLRCCKTSISAIQPEAKGKSNFTTKTRRSRRKSWDMRFLRCMNSA
jgi:hypothetical protein